MRVFISEYLTCGAWSGPPEPSLFREGRAMLEALALGCSRVAGCRVVTTWDARLDPPELPGVEVRRADGPAHEAELFRILAGECDSTLVIAPETGSLLAERRRTLDELGARALLSSAAAIELTADKLRLARHLAEHGIRTIPTEPLDFSRVGCAHRGEMPAAPIEAVGAAHPTPIVVKPRDGAGSLRTWRLSRPGDLERVRGEFTNAEEAIVQPFVEGRAVSMAAIVAPGGGRIELLPVADQRMTLRSEDGAAEDGGPARFEYRGGRIPATEVDTQAIGRLVRGALASIPGIAGYVGCDIIVPRGAPGDPLLVEINPRLTTSYLGYRAIAGENLAERILFPDRDRPPIRWRDAAVTFDVPGVSEGHRRLSVCAPSEIAGG